MAFNLSAIAAMAVLVGLGVAYLIDGMPDENEANLPSLITAGPTVEVNISGTTLAVPPAWFRFADQRKPGFAEKVDLIFALPLGADNRISEVEVSLHPATRARPSADLLDSVYLHQFTPNQVDGPLGLIGKPLKKQEGFENEVVWYDPVSVNPFVAKCIAPVAEDEPTSCIRTVSLTKQISATFVFDATLLQQWQRFDVEAGKWISRIGGV